MKAVILSAGQGRRLLPLTADTPKCALRIQGLSLLEWQLGELRRCGVEQATVIVGFGADRVEQIINGRYPPHQVRTLYNPFFSTSDNLVSCWMARGEMTEEFILLNGDTLFEAPLLRRVLSAPTKPVTLATDHKPTYDADDMKVALDGHRLVKVGKDLPAEEVHGESIGMLLFRGEGPALFSAALERAIRRPQALKLWYLSIIHEMAQTGLVWTTSIEGHQWTEVDCAADLRQAEQLLAGWQAEAAPVVGAGPV